MQIFRNMKLLALALFLYCNTCFAVSQQVAVNLITIANAEAEGAYETAMGYCNDLLNHSDISYVDKIHYLMARALLHLVVDDHKGFIADMEVLSAWMARMPACKKEYIDLIKSIPAYQEMWLYWQFPPKSPYT